MSNRSLLFGVFALLSCAACSQQADRIALRAPYDASRTLADVTAAWKNTGESRAFANGVRLNAPEVRFQYRLDLHNRSGEKLFLRLGNFLLADGSGLEVARDIKRIECTVGAADTAGVLSGDVWVPGSRAGDIKNFGLSHFAAPLADDARQRYREWLLQGRAGETSVVDAELARYAAAPACGGE